MNVEASDNCGIGIAGSRMVVKGEAMLNRNSSHGVVARIVNIASGQIRANEGYGVLVRPSGSIVPGGVLNLGAVNVSENVLGGIYTGASKLVRADRALPAHLAASTGTSSLVRGANISNNAGDGIDWQAADSLIVTGGNVSGNGGLGINTISGTGQIIASGNWWGDPSGPGGAGSGSGDGIAAGVTVADWLSTTRSIALSAAPDTLYVEAGATDTLGLSAFSWTIAQDLIDISIADSAGWVDSPLSFSLGVTDTTSAHSDIVITVPGGVAEGTAAHLRVTAQAQSDPGAVDTLMATILSYVPQLSAIEIVPDSVTVLTGALVHFLAFGFDQFDHAAAFEPSWSATGGTIDGSGLYQAGTTLGAFTVTAEDTTTALTAGAKVVITVATDVEDPGADNLPREFSLHQNYPNPFNPTTQITYDLPAASHVVLRIYNLLGQTVATLRAADEPAGSYTVEWDGRDEHGNEVASGLYLYRLTTDNHTATRKMMLLK